MNNTGEQSEFALYEFLRSTDTHSDSTQNALAFARIFADLARRVLAARAAQDGDTVSYPASLTYYTLRAYLDQGQEGLASRLNEMAGQDWHGAKGYLLSDLADWLARCYDYRQPQRTSLQVWVGTPGQQAIQLFGWASSQIRAGIPELPAPFELQKQIPVEAYLQDCAPDAACVMSHYDVHGLSMLALTLRYLWDLGISSPECAMGFEWTGDIGKLWKRAVPKSLAVERGMRAVLMLDTSVHSRKPLHTLKAVARLEDNPATRLILIDHHPDTFLLAPQLLQERMHLVLTDVFSCGLTRSWNSHELELMALGAISDKVPEIEAAYPPPEYPALHSAVEAYHRRHLHFSPTPKDFRDRGEYPLRPLWEALAQGRGVTAELADETLGPLPVAEAAAAPAYEIVGGVLVITQQLQSMGRAWYGVLEELMAKEELPYAIATRLLDRRRANFLLLTRWQWTHVPPIRYFIPERNLPQILGHPGALWADMDKDHAPQFLREVLMSANAFLGLEQAGDTAITLVKQNILDVEPVRSDTQAMDLPQLSEDTNED